VTVEVHIHTMGEFIDFKRADDMLWSLLEDLDHAMVLYEEDPLIDTLDAMHFRVVVLNVEPTTENIATLIFNQVLDRDYNVEKVVVHETAKYAAIAERQDQRIERVR
jgi:6-pyruvoyl-tetrahydropterin synthase